MPNPKVGTVTMDVGAAVKAAKQGSVEFKTDKTGVIHAPMGKVSFSRRQLSENIEAFVERMIELKPSGAPKGAYILSAHVSSSQGPGVPIDIRLAPFKAATAGASSSAAGAEGERSGTAALGAYARMHSVNGFNVVRYDLGSYPSEERVAQAKGKWPAVREQIKRSRKEKHSWKEALDRVNAINDAPALQPRQPAAATAAGGAKPTTGKPAAAAEVKAAKTPKEPKPAKE
jgi:hypothetical protein